jgi:hypothetical protein
MVPRHQIGRGIGGVDRGGGGGGGMVSGARTHCYRPGSAGDGGGVAGMGEERLN